MPKGGARTRSGPSPDPNALHRERDDGEWVTLPAVGRSGEPPEWPLVEPTDRELALWAREWARPQALMWERQGQELEVALYIRNLVAAEDHGAAVNRGTLVRQMKDSLGLTTPGLRSNRWRIKSADDGQKSAEPESTSSARDRFKVVNGEAG